MNLEHPLLKSLFFVNTHKHIHEVFLKTQNCSKKFRSQKLWIKNQRSSRNCSGSLLYHSVGTWGKPAFTQVSCTNRPCHPPYPTSGYQRNWSPKFTLALSIVSQSMVNSYILASPYFLLQSCLHLFETAGSSLQLATAPPDLSQPRGLFNTALLVSSQTARSELAVFQCKHSPELSCDVFKGKNKPPPTYNTQFSFFTPHFSYIKKNNLCCVIQSSCYRCACYNKKFFWQSFTNGWEFQGWNSNDSFCLEIQFHQNSTTKMQRQQN